MQARDAHNQQELAQLQTASQMSGQYGVEQFTKHERVAMKAVGDLRGELQTALGTSQAQHRHLDGQVEQNARSQNEIHRLVSQRDHLEASFKRMRELQGNSARSRSRTSRMSWPLSTPKRRTQLTAAGRTDGSP